MKNTSNKLSAVRRFFQTPSVTVPHFMLLIIRKTYMISLLKNKLNTFFVFLC
jgi:hypothetical protein